MRAALKHVYPTWQDDPHAEDSAGESKLVWSGRMRIVRSAKRMHQLKRRGVPIMHLGYGDGTAAQQTRSELGNLVPQGPWAWFVEEANPTRDVQQFLKRRARAKARRAERLREMFRAQLTDPHVLGLVITPFIHALDARPRRHWQDEPLPISGWNEFGTERPLAAAAVGIDYALRWMPSHDPTPRPDHYGIPYARTLLGVAADTRYNAGVPTHYEACPRCAAPLQTSLTGVGYCAGCGNSFSEIALPANDPSQCVDGWLCCNYFPVGEPVNGKQLMRCERPGCNKQFEDDCT